jgi:hypothetical protein
MPKLTPGAWDEIAGQYAAGVAMTVISKSFNVPRATIKRRADRLGWVRGSAEGRDAANQAKGQGAHPASSQEAAVAPVSDPRAALNQRHRDAWSVVHGLREEAFRILHGETPTFLKGIETGDVKERVWFAAKLIAMYEKGASALTTAQEGERRAYGIDYKQLQETTAKDDAGTQERRETARKVIATIDGMARRLENCRCGAAGDEAVPGDGGSSEPADGACATGSGSKGT